MRTHYALSAYPISRAFQAQLEQSINAPIQFLLLQDLRQKPLKELWKFLNRLKPKHFFLPLEDQNSHVLLPILQLIAQFTLPEKIVVMNHDLSQQQITLGQVIKSTLSICKISVMNYFVYRRSLYSMQHLAAKQTTQQEQTVTTCDNVLYLNANLWFGVKAGGSVGHIAGVVNEFAKKGMQVDYAAVDRSTLLATTVNYIPIPAPQVFAIPAELNYYQFNENTAQFLLKQKNKHQWNFIYQRMSVANYTGVVLSQTLRIPLVLEYNGSEAWVAKNWGRALRYHDAAVQAEEVCLKQAHVVVTISQVLKDELISRGVNENKIVCYPNCIDPELFNPDHFTQESSTALRAKHQIPADAVLCTFVGTFGQWHGVDVLAKTIRSLIDQDASWLQQHKVYFLLVGDGNKMGEVKQILGDAVTHPHVALIGLVPQNQAPAYLAASDILLSPHVANDDGSRFFGSPTKLFEYMAMRKAIISSNLEQMGEVLAQSIHADSLPEYDLESDQKENRLALLCKPGCSKQLAEGIRFLVEKPNWRIRLGTNARIEALAKYTWQHHVQSILSGLLSNKNSVRE